MAGPSILALTFTDVNGLTVSTEDMKRAGDSRTLFFSDLSYVVQCPANEDALMAIV